MGFVERANLPQRNVTHCIVSGQYKTVIDDLVQMGITPILVPTCNELQKPVSSHADMVCFHFGKEKIIVYDYHEIFTCRLKELGLQVLHTNQTLSPDYPNDIRLNAAKVGDWLICNTKHTEKSILNATDCNHIIHTKQGYAKCSTLIVDENAIITADSHIKRQAQAKGIDVLLIQQGYISLAGYEYGFIGGCGFKTNRKTIYFTGNIQTHPDYALIKQFFDERGVGIINGSSKALLDVGSILPIKETDA